MPRPKQSGIPDDLDARRLKIFDRFSNLQRLDHERTGHRSGGRVRHDLYVGRAKDTRANGLIKIATRPGLVFQQDLANEIATLSTINRELPESRYFPLLWEHGQLPDGRTFLIMSLFDEWPISTTFGIERRPDQLVGHIRAAIEVATALSDVHRVQVFHIDLNPMNILYRSERGRPLIRIVDFESSYEVSRHGRGAVYNPPTTPGFSAPEVHRQTPDGRADIFSLGAVLYTLMAGYEWRPPIELSREIAADAGLDAELRTILLKAVDVEPDQRFQSMGAFRSALGNYLESIWPGRAWQQQGT